MVVHSRIVDEHLVEFMPEDLSFSRLAEIIKQGDVGELKRASSHSALDLNTLHDEAGHNLLHIASIYGQADCAFFLIRNGMDLNQEDSFNGDTPLHRAMQGGHTECAALLLKNGALVDYKDKMGLTPLHEAMEKGNVKCVELLISHGAQLNPRDCDGYTPLHGAAMKEKSDCYVSLLCHGADDSIRAGEDDEDELTAKETAIEAWGEEWYNEVETILRMQEEIKECVPLLATVMREDEGINSVFEVHEIEDYQHVFAQDVLPFLYEFHSYYL